MSLIKIYAGPGADRNEVLHLADKLQTEIVEELEEGMLLLQVDSQGISLRKDDLIMQGDYNNMLSRVRPGKLQHEMLAKAAKIKNLDHVPTAIDATAGMGEDTLILAAAGYQVKLFERDPVIAVLLQDTLRRAAQIPELEEIVSRMHFVEGDSVEAMRNLEESPDLIYLDPMFPARSKSGLIKKKFQLLQLLESPCSDGDEMLRAAILAKPKKILIKRPAKGEFLGGLKPSHSIGGKAIRYDCLINVGNIKI